MFDFAVQVASGARSPEDGVGVLGGVELKAEVLRDRLNTLGWTTYRLAREVAQVREQKYGDKIERFAALIPGIEKAIAAPERSSGKTLECIVIALGGKLTIRWENKKTVSVIETVEEDF